MRIFAVTSVPLLLWLSTSSRVIARPSCVESLAEVKAPNLLEDVFSEERCRISPQDALIHFSAYPQPSEAAWTLRFAEWARHGVDDLQRRWPPGCMHGVIWTWLDDSPNARRQDRSPTPAMRIKVRA